MSSTWKGDEPMVTMNDPTYRDVDALARLAGPDMEQMLRAVKAGRPIVAPAEVRRRFGALCAAAIPTRQWTQSDRKEASATTRRTQRPASGTALAREIERVDELGVRVALAGLDEAIASAAHLV